MLTSVLRMRQMVVVVALVAAFTVIGQAAATAAPISVKLTSDALGLGSADINDGHDGDPVDADFPGKFVTSPVTGEGSILYVQESNAAGSGTALDPLFVTITAKGHLDTIGAPPDWYAGIIFISKESSDTPDGKKEGLGVRSFTVNPATGIRVIDPATGRARIEGSKHVSGGTETKTWGADGYPDFNGTKNGAPHVDEAVLFDFANPVVADSVVVRLSEFESTDVIDLSINVTHSDATQSVLTDTWLATSEAPLVMVGSSSDKVYDLVFANMPGLLDTDVVTGLQIRAIDDDPEHESGTAEHFWVTGVTATPEDPGGGDPVAEPSGAVLVVLGAVGGVLSRKRRS